MDNNTADYIRLLAERYETADFLKDDPSLFMHKVEAAADREVMAFAASCLSYARANSSSRKYNTCSTARAEGWTNG